LGQLQSERIEVVAESNEPIIAIDVREGDTVSAGASLLRQDATRLKARRAGMQAEIERTLAVLSEQHEGVRAEARVVAQARLDAVRVELALTQKTLERVQELRKKQLASQESADVAERNRQAALAQVAVLEAQLNEMDAGTRSQQIAQTEAQLVAQRAQDRLLEIDEERLVSRAGVAARVDSLPFEVGERPRVGDVVAVLLTGLQPLARVYIPETVRAQIDIGTSLVVSVDGVAEPLQATVLRVDSEATFTPYFALSEQDRGRLSYLAELAIDSRGARLPEGVPVQVSLEQYRPRK
jgi:HlyD family secretion protein